MLSRAYETVGRPDPSAEEGGHCRSEHELMRVLLSSNHGSALGRVDQITKGIRWMTWRQEAMKDVGTCEKL